MRTFFGGIAASLLLASMTVSGQTGQSVPMLDNESSGSWFVELASPPIDRGHGRRDARTRGSRLPRGRRGRGRPVLATGGTSAKLWNGVTVRASAGDVSKLRSLPGVQAVYPVVRIVAPAGRGSAGRGRRSRDGDQDDRRRHRAERARAVGPRRQGRRDRHRHRLRPPGSRRLLRPRLPRREGLRLRRRRLQLRPDRPGLQPRAGAGYRSRRLQRPRHARRAASSARTAASRASHPT